MSNIGRIIKSLFGHAKEDLSYGARQADKIAKEKVIPLAAKYALGIAVLLLIDIVPSVLLTKAGITYKDNWLKFWGGMWNIVFLVALLLYVAPLGIMAEIAAGGFKGAVRKYFRYVVYVPIVKLLFTMSIMIIPIENRTDLIPLYIISSLIIGFFLVRSPNPRLIGITVSIVMIGTVAAFVFPYLVGDVFKGFGSIGGKLEPLSKSCAELKSGVLRDRGGSNIYWYDVFKGKVILFDKSAKSPYHEGKDLKPFDEDALDRYCEQEEKVRIAQIPPPQPILEAPPEPVPPGGMMKSEISELKEEKPAPPSKPPDLIVRVVPPEIKTPKLEETVPKPKPAEPKPNPYVASSVGQKVSYAILITDSSGYFTLNDGNVATQRLREKGISASASVLSANFVRQGLFSQVFSGNTSKIAEYDFSRYADYLVLGKRSVKYGQDEILKSGAYTAEITVEIVIVSARTGAVASRFVSKGQGIGYSREEAEKGAISSACRNLASDITKHIT